MQYGRKLHEFCRNVLIPVFSADKQYGHGKKYPDMRKGVDVSMYCRWNEKLAAEEKVLSKDCLQSQNIAYYIHL